MFAQPLPPPPLSQICKGEPVSAGFATICVLEPLFRSLSARFLEPSPCNIYRESCFKSRHLRFNKFFFK